MELVNTHCHCVYSGHGTGSIAEYADAAAAAGLTTLAFTEHFPLSAAFDLGRVPLHEAADGGCLLG